MKGPRRFGALDSYTLGGENLVRVRSGRQMSYYRSQARVLRLINCSSSSVLLIAVALIASVALIEVQVVEAFIPLR